MKFWELTNNWVLYTFNFIFLKTVLFNSPVLHVNVGGGGEVEINLISPIPDVLTIGVGEETNENFLIIIIIGSGSFVKSKTINCYSITFEAEVTFSDNTPFFDNTVAIILKSI